MNNEQSVERDQSVSRQLLGLLLSPGGAREPIIRIEEVSRILALSGQSDFMEPAAKADSAAPSQPGAEVQASAMIE